MLQLQIEHIGVFPQAGVMSVAPIHGLFAIHESLSVAPSLRYWPNPRVLLCDKNALQFTINLISITACQ